MSSASSPEKTNDLLFSIIVPSYNYGHIVSRAIKSAITQPGSDYEVLVVDDGSTDDTWDILKSLNVTYPRQFTSYTRTNSGAAASRNYGINHSKGRWLIFLDADDELLPDALNIFRQIVVQNESVRLILGGHISVETDRTERYKSAGSFHFPGTMDTRFEGYLINKTITPSNGAMAMHRSIFHEYEFPETLRNCEDIPVFAYALARFNCISIDKPINRIHKHSDSLRHNIYYAEKHATALIDEIFNNNKIPSSLKKYRDQFTTQRYLSLFRTFYLAGKIKKAMHFYKAALLNDWKCIYKWTYTKKAIRAFFSIYRM